MATAVEGAAGLVGNALSGETARDLACLAGCLIIQSPSRGLSNGEHPDSLSALPAVYNTVPLFAARPQHTIHVSLSNRTLVSIFILCLDLNFALVGFHLELVIVAVVPILAADEERRAAQEGRQSHHREELLKHDPALS